MPVLGLAALVVLLLTILAFRSGAGRAEVIAATGGPGRVLHSLPGYHGQYVAIWTAFPALVVFILWALLAGRAADALVLNELPEAVARLAPFEQAAFLDAARKIAAGAASGISATDPLYAAASEVGARHLGLMTATRLAAAIGMVIAAGLGFLFARSQLSARLRARNRVEGWVQGLLVGSSVIAIATTLGIVASLVFETFRFFQEVSPFNFLFGLQWSAQTSIRADQVGGSGEFGAVPLFYGTLVISAIAMLVAVPTGLFAAIFLSEYAGPGVRRVVKPVLEVLAGIPTVVYGFFALLTVAPFVRGMGEALNGALLWLFTLPGLRDLWFVPDLPEVLIEAQPTSALAAGLVMGIMIIPFVSSLSDDVINAVPQSLRDGSLAMGATKSETVRNVVLPAALPGIVGAILLAVSRAVGETMIVVMAAGQRAQITPNPFSDVTTVTVQIVDLLTGDTEFDSPKTLSAFALGFVLFVVTLAFNFIALRVVQKYREKYD
jgi:phosphate transport system permease protein